MITQIYYHKNYTLKRHLNTNKIVFKSANSVTHSLFSQHQVVGLHVIHQGIRCLLVNIDDLMNTNQPVFTVEEHIDQLILVFTQLNIRNVLFL